MVLAALALTASLRAAPVARSSNVLRPAPVVVIDPGHGGKDSGARHGGVREDEVKLKMALTLAAVLRRHGYRVVLTRGVGCRPVWVRGPIDMGVRYVGTSGLPFHSCRQNLRDRVLDAARRRESLFLSLHCDHYSDPSVRGPRTYYGRGSDIQKALAGSIQHSLDAFRSRPFTPMAADHFVLVAQPNVPAVTVELGFLTNPRERALLETEAYRRDMAEAIARGVAAFARTHPLLPPPQVDRTAVERRWDMRPAVSRRKHRH